MMIRTLCRAALIAALAVPAAPLAAKPPLREVAEIDNALMAVAIADEVRKRCDGIGARLIRAYTTLTALERRARALGYSDDEIERYVTSSEEKARMRAKAEGWLRSEGVDPASDTALCAYGRAAMGRADDPVGRLLQ